MDRIDLRRARGSAASTLLSAGLGFLAGACGEETSSAATRSRLIDCQGRLHAEPLAPSIEVLREDFAAPTEDWSVFIHPKDVLAGAQDALVMDFRREGERRFLTLSGKGGASYRVLPIEPDTPYLFVGEVRARRTAPQSSGFFGASFWLGELSASGRLSGPFGADGRVVRHHRMPSAIGREGWQERSTAFRTTEDAHTLAIGCVLAANEALAQGEVDFCALRLSRLGEREFWEIEARRTVGGAQSLGEPLAAEDWRARRCVDSMLGGEQRPSILALPSDRLELQLVVPRGKPRLETGLAPWPRVFRPGATPLVFWLRVEGREILHETVALVGPLAEMSWRDVVCDLSAYAGRTVTLELGVDGPLPGVFGAPQVHASRALDPGWNVLFVSIDTLRADRIGAYGAPSGATPRVDAFAKDALVFEDMTANAPYTLPAHATLFSGQFPSVHGVEDRDRRLSPQRSPVLARVLAEHGYRTQAFASGGFVSPHFGFAHGFDGFSVIDPFRHPDSSYFAELRRALPEQCSATLTRSVGIERARAWLERHAEEPFFLFLHTYEVHDYDPPAGYATCAAVSCASRLTDYRSLVMRPTRRDSFPGSAEDRAHLGHLYDGALRHVDELLGGLFDHLARLELAERTIVVLTSDHGEELFERGHLQHGTTLYGEVLRIPLILRIPGEPPRRLSTAGMQVDLAPTLLRALGFPADERMQGLDLLRSPPIERLIWSEVNDLDARKSSVQVGGWKLVHGPRDAAVRFPNDEEWELFDLTRDPLERVNRAVEEPERLRRLRALHAALAKDLLERSMALGTIESGTEGGEALQRQLEHLGY